MSLTPVYLNSGLKLLTDTLQNCSNPIDIERKEILDDVNVACRTTLDILNDLLCFDKMESGILVAHKHEVPVISFISDCVDMFSAQAREANVTVSFVNCDKDSYPNSGSLPLEGADTVSIDRFKMDQVLRNLISNALKFTPRGGSVTVTSTFIPDMTAAQIHSLNQLSSPQMSHCTPSEIDQDDVISKSEGLPIPGELVSMIQIKSKRRAIFSERPNEAHVSTKGQLIINVKDSGTGMVKEDYSRLFKEIIQFNPEVLQAGGGSGLGLWITKGIVDLHKGEVSAHSEGLGHGSSFTVKLPMERHLRCSKSAVQDLHCKPTTVKPANSCLDSSNMLSLVAPYDVKLAPAAFENQHELDVFKPSYQLLIVDDSPLNRKMLQKIFRAAGHICDEAEDGVIAIAKVKEMMLSDAKAYTAILMDFVMPNMDGPTATMEIRALGYTAPIFGVTGNTLDSDIDYFLESGANKVFPKPLDVNIFENAIFKV